MTATLFSLPSQVVWRPQGPPGDSCSGRAPSHEAKGIDMVVVVEKITTKERARGTARSAAETPKA